MKAYTFYGASDDLIEVTGAERLEFTAPGYTDRGTFMLAAGDGAGAVRVHLGYEESGCWSVGVSPVDEDTPVPADWQFIMTPRGKGDLRVGDVPGYSAGLTVRVDDDAVLTWEGKA